jgi:predicted nucleic acid-binding protein
MAPPNMTTIFTALPSGSPESRDDQLYSSRADKEWGVVDCFSFELMRIRGVTQALTADHHFEQAGFTALLLHDVPA